MEGHKVFRISAATHQGLAPLLFAIWKRLEEAREEAAAVQATDERVLIKVVPKEDERHWEVEHPAPDKWVVAGKGLERMVAKTDMNNEYSVSRFQRMLERLGVNRKLASLGAQHGHTVRIGTAEFDYTDEERMEEYLTQ